MSVLPVTPERWPDLAELFEQRGPCGGHRNTPAFGCWCMWWRDRSLPHGEPKMRVLRELVRRGAEPGLLACDDGRSVGWVAVAPREEFTVLLRPPQYRSEQRRGGAAGVEAYPHAPKGDDYMGGLTSTSEPASRGCGTRTSA